VSKTIQCFMRKAGLNCPPIVHGAFPMAKITDKGINRKPGVKDRWLYTTIIWGHGTLEARITPSGERLFYFRYINSASARIRLPIGTYDNDGSNGCMTLADAIERATELASLHKSGIRDIREHLEAMQEATVAKLTAERVAAEAEATRLASRQSVNQLFEKWAKVELVRHKDGGKEAQRMIQLHVIPVIGDLLIENVRKSHIAEVLDPMLARGTPRMAKVILGKMRQMFRFALERDLIEADPTATFKKSKVGGKDIERDRVLSDEEIKDLAKRATNAGLLHTTQAAIWIALSTCCRIGELLSARWEHVNLEAGIWFIPAENSKNKKSHTINLSPFAVVQFRKLKTINDTSAWCYPSAKNTGPVSSKTITKQIADRQLAEDRKPMSKRSPYIDALKLKGGKWTPHDLRRTGATLMTVLGVLPEVAERCLNHTEENKIKRTYQRHTYTTEMREAWRLLGERLELLSRNDNDMATLNTKIRKLN